MQETQEIPGSGRSRGEGNGNPLQCSCLENYVDREAWGATVHEVAESDTTEHACNAPFYEAWQILALLPGTS